MMVKLYIYIHITITYYDGQVIVMYIYIVVYTYDSVRSYCERCRLAGCCLCELLRLRVAAQIVTVLTFTPM